MTGQIHVSPGAKSHPAPLLTYAIMPEYPLRPAHFYGIQGGKMSAPVLGNTIIIILVFANLTQLLLQGSRQRTRHEELKAMLQRIEAAFNK
jgi:hypothetical protein